mmetsp:Transcript_9489/g.14584  ORF Transcript_9489/g.14584 Transcript_9489/m.14584 type:complete len:246 (+) Transcript_9489:113-850(+)|eukprot:CAMPEP_0195294270 /NCGR_PEP_ID=MMETSP0707-20130614/14515_1 /TAXON_ID=33640 /ORGANISM="Asterionellopsis glacialis, Strain CCMP134" /LENGTH=245 /DNA_ID=CAMNT_0040355193 /DNA_START=110 /DNA_END=847 /DNA_ORIENTATION=-
MMDLAVKFNNIGVELLDGDRNAEASLLFRASLETMLLMSQCTEDVPVGNLLNTNKHIMKAQQFLRGDLNYLKSQQHSSTSFYAESSNFLVFLSRKGMKIIQENVVFHDDDAQENEVLSAIILYNVALVDHIKHILWPQINSPIYAVQKRYEMALDLLGDAVVPAFADLQMALINNLGLVKYQLGTYDQSKIYFTTLANMVSEVLNHFDPAVCGNLKVASNEGWSPEEYLLNARTLQLDPQAASAA